MSRRSSQRRGAESQQSATPRLPLEQSPDSSKEPTFSAVKPRGKDQKNVRKRDQKAGEKTESRVTQA